MKEEAERTKARIQKEEWESKEREEYQARARARAQVEQSNSSLSTKSSLETASGTRIVVGATWNNVPHCPFGWGTIGYP